MTPHEEALRAAALTKAHTAILGAVARADSGPQPAALSLRHRPPNG